MNMMITTLCVKCTKNRCSDSTPNLPTTSGLHSELVLNERIAKLRSFCGMLDSERERLGNFKIFQAREVCPGKSTVLFFSRGGRRGRYYAGAYKKRTLVC